jgi:hypothetical protein
MARVLDRPRPVSVTVVRAVPGIALDRPPGVAVLGLRRSGRTGNGESPAGASRPPAGLLRSHPMLVRGSA